MKKFDFEPLRENLKRADSVLITFPAKAAYETIAASLALYLSLINSRKKVTIASALQPTVGLANLVGIDKIKQEEEGGNLVISFNYVQDSIEKVSYNIENNKFNLVIQAKDGFPPLDPGSVSYSQTGTGADLVFVVGALNLDSLADFYQKSKNIFENSLMVNIDNQANNSQFGKFNFTDPQMSLSEIVVNLIKATNLSWNADVVGNLFLGLKQGTNNFSQRVKGETFEAAAWCLKQGAKIPTESSGSSTQSVGTEEEKELQVPPDWLGPKIFQSSKKI